jgi:hypothetical protein
MGAAIECFAGAAAIEVPRTRFAPVKTTADLLVLRSDACVLTPDWRVELHPDREGQPPVLDLDPKETKLVDGLETVFGTSAPSLLACDRLLTRGPMTIPAGAAFVGEVEIHNPSSERIAIPARLYEDETVSLAP